MSAADHETAARVWLESLTDEHARHSFPDRATRVVYARALVGLLRQTEQERDFALAEESALTTAFHRVSERCEQTEQERDELRERLRAREGVKP